MSLAMDDAGITPDEALRDGLSIKRLPAPAHPRQVAELTQSGVPVLVQDDDPRRRAL